MGGATIVVADEPTAELDSVSAEHVMDTMVALAHAGVTFVVATHDRSVMRRADAALELDHGSAGPPAARRPLRRTEAVTLRSASNRGRRSATAPTGGDRRVSASWVGPSPIPLVLGNGRVEVLPAGRRGRPRPRRVSLALRAGELVGLVGRSGSGKTTLLNVIAGWEHADAGTIERPDGGRGPRLGGARGGAAEAGLFDELTVRENLEYPARLSGRLGELRGRVDELMEDLGIAHLAARYPKETSLGEQQRTAIARALVLSPTLVLADEPTGHQDAVSERRVLEALGRAAADGASCLIATHNVALAPRLDRVVEMADGRLSESAAAS